MRYYHLSGQSDHRKKIENKEKYLARRRQFDFRVGFDGDLSRGSKAIVILLYCFFHRISYRVGQII